MFTPEFIAVLQLCVLIVMGVLDALKKWMKLPKPVTVILSFVISGVVCAVVMRTDPGGWGFGGIVVASIVVFLEANGWYKFLTSRFPKK